MEQRESQQSAAEKQPITAALNPALQRQCACGGSAGPSGECAGCRQQRLGIQPKLAVNQPDDRYEQEAEQVADRVMRMPDAPTALPIQRQATTPVAQNSGAELGLAADADLAQQLQSRQGDGQPLPADVRTFMEARLGADFTRVRVHTDAEANGMSRQLQAQAFTHQQAIYYGAGKTPGKDALTAHELTHVLQQTERGAATHTPAIQRVLEVRPPGRGEASAFDRRQELIDRLNGLSPAIQYHLDGRRILYAVIDEATLTAFDRQMMAFIDRAEVTPMRLITRAGRVSNGAGGFAPLLIDSFDAGYVDLDDMLASSDLSFQLNLVHLLEERFQVRNYARRIGTGISEAEFNRAHRAGINVEAQLLQDVLGDPTIRFNYEETRPNGTLVFAFRSAEGYRVFHVFRRATSEERGGTLFVQTSDGRRLTIEELRAERAAAAQPAAP